MSRNRDLANILSSSGNVALDSELALNLITPTSIAATGGSGSISTTGTVSFTSASAISLNGCFTSTYDNYRVLLQIDSSSTGAGIQMRFRASGSDNTSSLYYSNGQLSYAYNTGHFATVTNPSSISCDVVVTEDNVACIAVLDISNVQQARRTVAKGQSGSKYRNQHFNIYHDSTTQFDGFSFIIASGTMTGSVRVYGYRN